MKWRGDIQEYLSLGYIYLLLLGVTSDSIYYSILGINILSYSTILDVLLSPFVHLTKSIAFPVVIALIILATYMYRKRVSMIYEKRKQEDISKNAEQSQINNSMLWVVIAALAVFGAYIGLGVGKGLAVEEKILSGNFTPDHKITFHEQGAKEVYIIGNNTEYIFFVEKEGHHPMISPIEDNVLWIERINRITK